VTGLGNDRAGRIWYRALTAYMLSNSNYSAARLATLQAATDLYGAGGTEYRTVDAAWKAVGVDGSDPVPQSPAIMTSALPTGAVGDPVNVQVVAKDPQGDSPITFRATGLPPGVSISPSGLISGTPTVASGYLVDVYAADPAGNVGRRQFEWLIRDVIVVVNPGDQTATVGRAVNVPVTVTYPRAPGFVYSATGLPAGVTINSTSGVITGLPTRPGTTTSTVTVALDGNHVPGTMTFTWTVKPSPRSLPRPPALVG
jgi:hypothetical protein